MSTLIDQWRVVDAHLKETTQGFLDTCMVLQNSMLRPIGTSRGTNLLKDITTLIQSRLDSLDIAEGHISKSRIVLRRMLNRSTELVPISRLPSELLSRVFEFISAPYYLDNHYDTSPNPLVVISSVCAQWREVAIQNASLWSHVDLNANFTDGEQPQYKIARLWMERARGTPLHVHLTHGKKRNRERLPDLVSTIVPYANHVSSLRAAGFWIEDIFQIITDIRTAQSTDDLIATLVIEAISLGTTMVTNLLNWPTILFKNLFELQLIEIPTDLSPTLYDIATILSGCPTLHTFRIHRTTIRRDDNRIYPLITLPYLRRLHMQYFWENGSPTLLSLLRPGDLELHLEVDILTSETACATATAFMSRPNVTSLYLDGPQDANEIEITAHFLSSNTRSLRSLLLYLGDSNTSDCLRMLAVPGEQGAVPRVASLKTLCLVDAEIDMKAIEALEELLIMQPLEKVVFVSCYAPMSDQLPLTALTCIERDKLDEILRPVMRRVPKIIFQKEPPYKSHEKWDRFLRTEILGG